MNFHRILSGLTQAVAALFETEASTLKVPLQQLHYFNMPSNSRNSAASASSTSCCDKF